MKKENRREFLVKLSAMTAVILSPLPMVACKAGIQDKFGQLLPQRILGSTGEKVTMIGLGGAHAGQTEEMECERIIERAIELGIRFFDTAESYQDGISEERYGKYLTPKFRDHIFLLTKTRAKDAATAKEHLEGSLRRLKTDYLDLWKMHDIRSPGDVNDRLQNGVLETMLKAQEEGKVRHIGFTGHATYKAHAHMLQVQEEFSTCLMPINVADPSYESFILNVMPELQKQEYGIMAMKTLGAGGLMGAPSFYIDPEADRPNIIPDKISIEEALHFVWSLPVSTIISGCEMVEELEMNVKAARSFVEMNEEQRNTLITKVSDLASTGNMEWYKE